MENLKQKMMACARYVRVVLSSPLVTVIGLKCYAILMIAWFAVKKISYAMVEVFVKNHNEFKEIWFRYAITRELYQKYIEEILKFRSVKNNKFLSQNKIKSISKRFVNLYF
jgi:hypothetical protein